MTKLSFTVATEDVKDPKILAMRGNLEKNLAILSQLGYHGVEFMVRDVKELSVQQTMECCQRHKLEIAAISSGQIAFEDGLILSSLDDKIYGNTIQRMEEIIDFTASVGCQLVNIGTIRGNLPNDPNLRKEAQIRFKEGMISIAKYAVQKGVSIALEPQSRYLVNWQNSIKENLEFIESINQPNLKLLFDCYHTMLEEENIIQSLIKNIKMIAHIQFSDSNRYSPGTGMLPFYDMVRVLKVLDYQGFVSVEVLQKPSGEEAAKQAASFLLPILNEQLFYHL